MTAASRRGRTTRAHRRNVPMKLTIKDHPTGGPRVEFEEDGRDIFVVVNGVTIARHTRHLGGALGCRSSPGGPSRVARTLPPQFRDGLREWAKVKVEIGACHDKPDIMQRCVNWGERWVQRQIDEGAIL